MSSPEPFELKLSLRDSELHVLWKRFRRAVRKRPALHIATGWVERFVTGNRADRFKKAVQAVREKRRIALRLRKKVRIVASLLLTAAQVERDSLPDSPTWEAITKDADALAEWRLQAEEREHANGRRMGWITAIMFLLAIAWAAVGWRLPFAPLVFREPTTSYWGGLLTQFVALFVVAAAAAGIIWVIEWIRPQGTPGSVVLCLMGTILLAASAGEIAAQFGWWQPPRGWAQRAMLDGCMVYALWIGVFMAVVLVQELVTTIWRNRRIWNDPRLALMDEILLALWRLLPPEAADGVAAKHALRGILKKYRGTSEPERQRAARAQAAVEKFADGDNFAESNAVARGYFWKPLLYPHTPDAVEAGMSDLISSTYPPGTEARWPQPAWVLELTRDLREAASAIEVLPSRLRTRDPARDEWLTRACRERAAYLRNLQTWLLLPRPDTRTYLGTELRQLLRLVCAHDWGAMPFIELKDLPQPTLWQRLLTGGKTLVVAGLPLAAIIILEAVTATLPPALGGTLWTLAFGWAVVSVLPLLDSRFSEKLPHLEKFTGLFKGKE